jgi:hypothetical protein
MSSWASLAYGFAMLQPEAYAQSQPLTFWRAVKSASLGARALLTIQIEVPLASHPRRAGESRA